MKKNLFVFSVFLYSVLTCATTLATTSTFLERSSPLIASPTSLYLVKENIFYASSDFGLTWEAAAIAPTLFEDGMGSLALQPEGNRMALFLVNKEGKPALYNSPNKGETWVQKTISTLNFTFNDKMFVNLLIEPQNNYYYLFVYDLSQQSINLETSLLFSKDLGDSWSQINTQTTFPEGAFLIGPDTKEKFLNPLYAVRNQQTTAGYAAHLYTSSNQGTSFTAVDGQGLPSNSMVFWLSLDPTNSAILYATVILSNETTALYKSSDGGQTWIEFKTDKNFNDQAILGMQVNPVNNQILYVYTEKKIFSSIDGGITFTELPVAMLSEVNFLILDQYSANYYYYVQNSTKELLRTTDGGKNWQKITPHFEAEWVSQTQGTGTLANSSLKPFVAEADDKISLQARFKNAGNVVWHNSGDLKVGFYVYKDVVYSGPPEYSDPNNVALFGKSWFADSSWGPSADGKTPNARASLLKEGSILPGGIGTFNFVFKVPTNATPSPETDDTKTKYDDRYIREDLTVAWGPNWMDNTNNGDPLKRAHIWVPVQIVQ